MTTPELKSGEEKPSWERFGWLPCALTLELPIPEFTVGELLRMEPGSVLNSRRSQTADIPLKVNSELVGWTEFEVIGSELAVRITELA
jgi:flagellar motor switch/type III secretory pathway protein FliN